MCIIDSSSIKGLPSKLIILMGIHIIPHYVGPFDCRYTAVDEDLVIVAGGCSSTSEFIKSIRKAFSVEKQVVNVPIKEHTIDICFPDYGLVINCVDTNSTAFDWSKDIDKGGELDVLGYTYMRIELDQADVFGTISHIHDYIADYVRNQVATD